MSPGSTIITCASVNHYIGRPDLLDYTSTKGNRSLHARPLQPANRKRNSRQRRLSRPDLDASHPSYHEREGAEGVHKSDGKTGTA